MLFTSEQVSCGHPDKICDQISDAILDKYLSKDRYSRVAVETMIKDNNIIVAGEVTSKLKLSKSQIDGVIFSVLKDIGIYDETKWNIQAHISEQSTDISRGVDVGGAGDQGIVFGYACNETIECLPLAYMLATRALQNLRKLNHPMLKPDAKSQVTVRYLNGAISIDTFLISTQHSEGFMPKDVEGVVIPIMLETAKEYGMNTEFKVLINPTGRFVTGGSFGDCGITGRKIIADSYGGYAKHGGGAYSSKDPTKVDRSAAYMARYLAKYLLKKYSLKECEIQLAYAIGVANPVSLSVKSSGISTISEEAMVAEILCNFDLTPSGIIGFLGLRSVKYYETAKYGHFTNQKFPWESINLK